MSKDRVIVAMSGGVDSSVAAALLKKEGYKIIGVTMKIWMPLRGLRRAQSSREGRGEPHLSLASGSGKSSDKTRCNLPRVKEEIRHACYGPGEKEDIEDARKVAQILDIPFYTFDLREEYKINVLDYFYNEYLSGRTPNPCIRCNRVIKLGALIEKVRNSGVKFDYIATGHYAKTIYDEKKERYLLMKARDLTKDQSYFLFSLSQEQLRQCLFPLGNFTKKEVKNIAKNWGLGVENKPESQDFIAGGHSAFLKTPGHSNCPLHQGQPGPIVNKEGKTLGEHKGIQFYTIGQRKGLRIPAGKPLYVIAIDHKKNTIIVGTKEETMGNKLIASELNWIAITNLKQVLTVKAKIRYLHKEAEAEILPFHSDSSERAIENKVYVKFKEPQMAITPGQAVVFYDEDIVVGGGVIESTY